MFHESEEKIVRKYFLVNEKLSSFEKKISVKLNVIFFFCTKKTAKELNVIVSHEIGFNI